MAELQSFIERQIEQKERNMKEINSIILSNFLEFQKQNKELRNFPEFQKQNQALRKELQDITTFANTQIRNIQNDMYKCEQDYIYEMEHEEQEIEAEIEEEFEKEPCILAKNRVKSKPAKKTKTFDRKFVMNILYSNSKTTDKLPRVIIEQTLRSRTKPKYKNRGL
jgi:hypothetical protein